MVVWCRAGEGHGWVRSRTTILGHSQPVRLSVGLVTTLICHLGGQSSVFAGPLGGGIPICRHVLASPDVHVHDRKLARGIDRLALELRRHWVAYSAVFVRLVSSRLLGVVEIWPGVARGRMRIVAARANYREGHQLGGRMCMS